MCTCKEVMIYVGMFESRLVFIYIDRNAGMWHVSMSRILSSKYIRENSEGGNRSIKRICG